MRMRQIVFLSAFSALVSAVGFDGPVQAGFIMGSELHVDLADLFLAVDVVLVHLDKPGHASVTRTADIPDGLGNDLLALFSCCVFDKYAHALIIAQSAYSATVFDKADCYLSVGIVSNLIREEERDFRVIFESVRKSV